MIVWEYSTESLRLFSQPALDLNLNLLLTMFALIVWFD